MTKPSRKGSKKMIKLLPYKRTVEERRASMVNAADNHQRKKSKRTLPLSRKRPRHQEESDKSDDDQREQSSAVNIKCLEEKQSTATKRNDHHPRHPMVRITPLPIREHQKIKKTKLRPEKLPFSVGRRTLVKWWCPACPDCLHKGKIQRPAESSCPDHCSPLVDEYDDLRSQMFEINEFGDLKIFDDKNRNICMQVECGVDADEEKLENSTASHSTGQLCHLQRRITIGKVNEEPFVKFLLDIYSKKRSKETHSENLEVATTQKPKKLKTVTPSPRERFSKKQKTDHNDRSDSDSCYLSESSESALNCFYPTDPAVRSRKRKAASRKQQTKRALQYGESEPATMTPLKKQEQKESTKRKSLSVRKKAKKEPSNNKESPTTVKLPTKNMAASNPLLSHLHQRSRMHESRGTGSNTTDEDSLQSIHISPARRELFARRSKKQPPGEEDDSSTGSSSERQDMLPSQVEHENPAATPKPLSTLTDTFEDGQNAWGGEPPEEDNDDFQQQDENNDANCDDDASTQKLACLERGKSEGIYATRTQGSNQEIVDLLLAMKKVEQCVPANKGISSGGENYENDETDSYETQTSIAAVQTQMINGDQAGQKKMQSQSVGTFPSQTAGVDDGNATNKARPWSVGAAVTRKEQIPGQSSVEVAFRTGAGNLTCSDELCPSNKTSSCREHEKPQNDKQVADSQDSESCSHEESMLQSQPPTVLHPIQHDGKLFSQSAGEESANVATQNHHLYFRQDSRSVFPETQHVAIQREETAVDEALEQKVSQQTQQQHQLYCQQDSPSALPETQQVASQKALSQPADSLGLGGSQKSQQQQQLQSQVALGYKLPSVSFRGLQLSTSSETQESTTSQKPATTQTSHVICKSNQMDQETSTDCHIECQPFQGRQAQMPHNQSHSQSDESGGSSAASSILSMPGCDKRLTSTQMSLVILDNEQSHLIKSNPSQARELQHTNKSIRTLEYWRDLQAIGEHNECSRSSRALASLILEKNKRASPSGTSFWLPTLLDDISSPE